MVAWPDFGVLPLPALKRLVMFARNHMEATTIEIACCGGHGRTDTLLACLIADIENVDGDTAIKLARLRHCKHGIETEEQEELVRRFRPP
jgi:protein-tyrosine phosphatase